jgi:hypothetical protein
MSGPGAGAGTLVSARWVSCEKFLARVVEGAFCS